jgi:NTE family protein
MAVFGLVVSAGSVGAQAPACSAGRTALVLSGGGAKGLAHLGVIAAMDSLGIRPDYVVGTSMGAIIGALYAGGATAREVNSLASEFNPTSLFSSTPAAGPLAWGSFSPLLTWARGANGVTLQSPTVDVADANALLSALLLRPNLLALGDFNQLPIPFRAVATDLVTRDTVVLSSGDLAQAVRASTSVPVVFPPELVDGRLLVDGGLSANVPISVARSLPGVTRVIVSDVTSPLLTQAVLETGPLAVADQLAGFLFVQPPDSVGPDDVYVRVDLGEYKNLDFAPASMDSIQRRGRRAADAALATASCLPIGARVPDAIPRHVHQFELRGGAPTDGVLLEQFLGLVPGATIDEPVLARQVDAVGQLGAYTGLWLHPTAAANGQVSFDAVVQPAPSRLAGVTGAYDRDLGGRAGMMYLDRRLFGRAYEGSATLGVGTLLNDLDLGLRRYFGVGRAWLAPTLTVHLENQALTLYDSAGQDVGRADTRQGVLFAGIEHGATSGWVFGVGVDGRLWKDGDATAAGGSPSTTGSSGGIRVSARDMRGVWTTEGEMIWSTTFQRVGLATSYAVKLGRWTVTPIARVGWGEDLPLQDQFPLGGSEGFPGLAVEELRGNREVFTALEVSHPISGSLRWELLAAAGRSANGGDLFAVSDWLGGLRAGLAVETPVGDVVAAYGRTTTGIDNVFVRIGRWF